MGSSLRIQVLLESELRRNLQFSVADLENETSPGAAVLRRGDFIRYRLFVRNDGDLPFRRVAGFATETPFVAFSPIRFEIQDLRPREEVAIGTVHARVLSDPSRFEGTDGLARLTLVASAALDEVTVREADRSVGYVPARRAAPSFGSTPRSIPLSS